MRVNQTKIEWILIYIFKSFSDLNELVTVIEFSGNKKLDWFVLFVCKSNQNERRICACDSPVITRVCLMPASFSIRWMWLLYSVSACPFPLCGFTSSIIWHGRDIWLINTPTMQRKENVTKGIHKYDQNKYDGFEDTPQIVYWETETWLLLWEMI